MLFSKLVQVMIVAPVRMIDGLFLPALLLY